MARYPRSKRDKCFTHTLFRGVRKTPLFNTESDYSAFLNLLDKKCLEYNVKLIDYTVMPNHAHLIPMATGKALGSLMRDVLGTYARRFNDIYETNGHVLEARYKTFLIRRPAWLRRTSEYLHMNPVFAGLCNRPWDYPWCSAPTYAGLSPGLQCLDTTPVLSLLDPDPTKAVTAYTEQMQELLQRLPSEKEQWNRAVRQAAVHNLDAERIRIAKEQALSVRDTIISIAAKTTNSKLPPQDVLQLLWIHYVRKWRVCPSWLLAVVMGISDSKVRRIGIKAPTLIKKSPEMRRLAQAIDFDQDQLCA